MKQNFKQKLLAGLLSVCMMFQTAGTVPVYAVGNTAGSGLSIGTSSVCTHHVHDENCGYSESTPCTFDPATCEICNPKDSNAQEIPKESIAKAASASESVTLDIADGAIKIFPTGYKRNSGGGVWSGLQAHIGSYVITGTSVFEGNLATPIEVTGLAPDATLTLQNLKTVGHPIALSLAGDQTVRIEDTVSLGGKQTAIKATGALNLTGDGSLALSVVNAYPQPQGQDAAAAISAASVEANLGGAITVTATAAHADKPAAIHAIKTTTGGVSLTSQNGAVSLTSSGTTAPLIMSAGAVTISGYGNVAVESAGELAILASDQNVSLTSEIGTVNVTGNGNSPAIQASAVTIHADSDVTVESTGGPAIIADGGEVSLTSKNGWVKVTGNGNGPAIQASAVTISGKTDVAVTNAGAGSGISASGEVSLTSESSWVEVSSTKTAISSGKLTIHSNERVLLSSTDSQAISTSGAVSLTSDNSNVTVNGNDGAPAIQASTLTIAAKDLVTVENGNADAAIMATGAVSLNAADVYVGGLISASNSTVTFTAPEGAMVISEINDKLITGTVTVAANTQLKLFGNTTGITYADDGSASRTTAYAGDLSAGGTVRTVGTYIAGDGKIVVAQSDDGKYTATMTNASVGGDLEFGVDCTLTLVGKNQVENGLYLLNEPTSLTINGTGGLVAQNIEANNITINGGTVNAVNIFGDGENGTISITDGTVNAANISSEGMNGTISITGGTVNADTIVAKTPSITGGTVNAIVQNITIGEKSVTVYGNVTLTQDLGDFPNTSTFTVPAGRSLTVPSGVKLYLLYCTGDSENGTADTKAITNKGAMTINGELVLPNAFKSEGTIKGLKLTGSGSVKVSNGEEQPGTTYTAYFTDGSQPHTSTTKLNFNETTADAGNLTDDGYEWKKDTKTLTLKNLWLESNDAKAITLPDGAKLVLQGMSTVIGESSAIYANGNLTVSGATGILKFGSTSGYSIEVEGTLTVDSGTILSAGGATSMCAETIAIKDGTIDLGAHGSMTAMTTLTISGGNVTTGDNRESMCAKDIVISGGKVKTGGGSQGSIWAMDLINGTARTSINITGGTVIANGGNHPSTPIGILAMNGDISITGGTVTAIGGIDSGISGVIVGGGIAAIDGTITTTGMTATTTPVGGTVKSGTVGTQDTPMTVTSYTAEAELQAEGEFGMVTNACTTVSLAKTQIPSVTSVTISPKNAEVQVGKTTQLTAAVAVINGADKTVTWKSSDATKATVDANGLITAVAAGTVSITATSTVDSTKSDSATVIVTSANSGGSDGDSSSGGGSDSGSGSGSTGDSTTVPTPTPTPAPTPKAAEGGSDTQKPTAGKATAAAEVDAQGKATVTVPEKSITDAITNAQQTAKKNGTEQNGISVEIEVTSDENINSVSTTFSEESIKELVDAGVKEVTFKSKMGDITIDLETLQQIQKEQGGDITITVSKADISALDEKLKKEIGDRPVYELNITRGDGTRVTNFDGSITIAIPYTLQEGEDPANIAVVYMNEKGEKEIMSGSGYDEKTQSVIFTTRHFSTFAIVLMPDKNDAPITDIVEADGTTPDVGNGTETAKTQGGISAGIMVAIVIASILAIAIVAVGVFAIVKKRRE